MFYGFIIHIKMAKQEDTLISNIQKKVFPTDEKNIVHCETLTHVNRFGLH